MSAQVETRNAAPTQNEQSSESLLQIRGLKKRFSFIELQGSIRSVSQGLSLTGQ